MKTYLLVIKRFIGYSKYFSNDDNKIVIAKIGGHRGIYRLMYIVYISYVYILIYMGKYVLTIYVGIYKSPIKVRNGNIF